MEFEISDELRAFVAEVDQFICDNWDPEVMDPMPEQLSQVVDTPPKRAFMRKLAAKGWLGMSWPKEYGGQERSGMYEFLLTERLARVGAPQPGKGVGTIGKTIIRHGNAKLKEYFLPRIARGEIEFAIGYSEPQAGSDAAAMQLKATRDGAGWRLNGRKIWTTSGHFADWYWVGARTDPEAPKHKGITLFLVEMRHPGITIQPTWTIGDERTNEVFIDDVWVGDDFVVGELNKGWTYICEALDLERFGMMPIGAMEMKVDTLCRWALKAERDGAPLRADPVARHTIAQLVTQLQVARNIQRRVVSEALKGRVPTVESSMHKLYVNELDQRIANGAMELMGPAGLLKRGNEGAPMDGRFERSYRYTVVNTIGGGTSEIQKNIIARRQLGLPLVL